MPTASNMLTFDLSDKEATALWKLLDLHRDWPGNNGRLCDAVRERLAKLIGRDDAAR